MRNFTGYWVARSSVAVHVNERTFAGTCSASRCHSALRASASGSGPRPPVSFFGDGSTQTSCSSTFSPFSTDHATVTLSPTLIVFGPVGDVMATFGTVGRDDAGVMWTFTAIELLS